VRTAFVETLCKLAAEDERVVLLTADIGYNALEPFVEKFPARFFNVGVAEQNMVAVATGLAEAGFVPFCYSIASFAVLRPYEFIRNGPILHQLPVRIVGMGGGLEYASNGVSHHGIDDLGALRVQPGISLFAPADARQTRSILEQTAGLAGPIYYRLEKDDSLSVPGLDGRFTVGRPEHVIVGQEILFVASGGIAAEVVAAARELASQKLPVGVAVVSSLNPVDRTFFADLLRGYRAVISVEAHYTTGALGSLTAEVIAESRIDVRLVRCGLTGVADGLTGSHAWMKDRAGLSRAALARTALTLAADLALPSNPIRR
jgi:transketolase